jgi:acetolactate synthase-1/2/3 large subunit
VALRPGNDRRSFLTGIGVVGAAITIPASHVGATGEPAQSTPSAGRARALAQADVAPTGISPDPPPAYVVRNPGSDFMIDCLRDLGYDYVAATPGSTFRGLQESVISYAGNAKPEWITVVHEEISVALAHGYYKASGKPMAAMVHNTVGVQHASMAIYDAWADRVPLLLMTGNYADSSQRTLGAEWDHSAVDDAAMLRGYIKYDDQPASLQHFSESIQRAHGLAMTAPGRWRSRDGTGFSVDGSAS